MTVIQPQRHFRVSGFSGGGCISSPARRVSAPAAQIGARTYRGGCGDPPRKRSCRRLPRAGFTLVELVTAASLMTVLMMGVVEIFGIVTETAGRAEGAHFAHQQMRPLFDRLYTDLRGMTREGYLSITQATAKNPTGTGPLYHIDTLAFVTVGPCISSWTTTPKQGLAAEVVYTNNVYTPTNLWKVESDGGSVDVYARRGLLGRGQWMLAGETGGAATDREDRSAAATVAEIFSDQGLRNSTRVKKQGTYLTVWPWSTLAGVSQEPNSLSRVMASCTSEFYVEVYDPQTQAFQIESTTNRTQDWWWSTATNTDTELVKKTWPQAIRVTVAVHDPGDSSRVKTNERARGYALQEIFWISDP